MRNSKIISTMRITRGNQVLIGVKLCDIPRKLTREDLIFTSRGYSFFNKQDLSKSFLEMCTNK